MTQPTTSFGGKATAPPIDNAFIRREVQITAMDSALERRVTIITGSAGYGKSTVAAQWQHKAARKCAWLSLDIDENELRRFAGLLVAAIQHALPDSCERLVEMVRSPQAFPAVRLAEAFIGDAESWDEHVVVVFDDLHLISSQAVHDFLVHVIEHQPEHLRLVVLTRNEPPWPLQRWKVRGWVSELGNRDLCFSLPESVELFQTSLKPDVSEELIAGIHQRVEGWPAGLRLVLLSMQESDRREDVAKEMDAASRQLSRYFLDEVIEGLPEELKEFLELTAPLNRFCAELCDELRSHDGNAAVRPSRDLIDEFRGRQLFLVPLDREDRWYRYHHLFAELLSRRLEESSRSSHVAAIYRRAGGWFARNGFREESLDYLIQGNDVEAAAGTLWEALPGMLSADLTRRSLDHVLAKFPREAIQECVELMLADAFVRIARFDLGGLEEVLDDAEVIVQRTDSVTPLHTDKKGVLLALQTFLSYWRGDMKEAWQQGSEALRLLPKEFRIGRTYATTYGVGGLMMCGQFDESIARIERAITEDAASGNGTISGYITCKAMIHSMSMQIDGVLQATRKMRQMHALAPMPDYWFSYASYLEGLAAYERNQLDQARQGLLEALSYGVRLHGRHFHDILVSLCHVAMAAGEMASAWDYADQARKLAVDICDPTSVRVSDAADARLRSVAGESLSAQPPAPEIVDAVSYFFEIPSLIYAELLLDRPNAAGQEQALKYIDQALALVEPRHHRRHVIVLTLLKAMALDALGQHESAELLLNQTLRWGEELGLVRTFLDRGERLRGWLERFWAKRPDDQYVASLLDAFRSAGEQSTNLQNANLADKHALLSQREMDVLELLQQRLSNKQIASKLNISAETVKKHSLSIYRKLEVHSRREAVILGERSGLLRSSKS